MICLFAFKRPTRRHSSRHFIFYKGLAKKGNLVRIVSDPEGRLSNNPMPETTFLNEWETRRACVKRRALPNKKRITLRSQKYFDIHGLEADFAILLLSSTLRPEFPKAGAFLCAACFGPESSIEALPPHISQPRHRSLPSKRDAMQR